LGKGFLSPESPLENLQPRYPHGVVDELDERPWVVGLLAVFLMGCADRGETRRHPESRLASPGGWVEVANDDGPLWSPESSWWLREDLVLGAWGDEVEFGFINEIQTDGRGRLYVSDWFAHRILVFEPCGSLSFSIGGRGEGPGEFGRVGGMVVAPGDTLLVTDTFLHRYSVFAPDGTFVRGDQRGVLGSYEGQAGVFLESGDFLEWGYGEVSPPGAGRQYSYRPVRVAEDFRSLEWFPSVDFPMELTDGGRPQVFFAAVLWVHLDSRGAVWFANGREYRVFRRTLEGDTTLTFTLGVTPARILPSERESIRDAHYLRGLSQTKPVIHGLTGDNMGHIFVLPEEEGVPAGTVLDIFQDSGVYLGRVALPRRAVTHGRGSTLVATGSHVYYVWENEMGAHGVARAAIHGGPA
jgi:hypothetical protein